MSSEIPAVALCVALIALIAALVPLRSGFGRGRQAGKETGYD